MSWNDLWNLLSPFADAHSEFEALVKSLFQVGILAAVGFIGIFVIHIRESLSLQKEELAPTDELIRPRRR